MTEDYYKPCVICGPSGVGKRTMVNKLRSKLPDTFGVTISHTTRKQRSNETPDIDYYFVDKQQFEVDIKNNKFIEYVLYDNQYYGTSFKSINDVKEQKLICLLEIDVFGAEKIQKAGNMECNYLFMTTSNGLETLEERMLLRNTESREEINRRLETAKKELEFVQNNPNFFDSVISNDKDMDETYYLLQEQFLSWYPSLKNKISNLNEENKEDDEILNLGNIGRKNRVSLLSKRQSMDLFADFRVGQQGQFITQESLCRDILNSEISPFQYNETIISMIVEYTDIAPKNRKKEWKQNEYIDIINNVSSSVEHRWTLGNNIDYYPQINIKNIGDIYFAYHEIIMNGVIFYLCGTIRCPIFTKKYYGFDVKNENNWDGCWDIYFYMKCDTNNRGSIQFSRQWTNMLIFGIDSDAVRQATENGIWKLNVEQSNNFLIKSGSDSSADSINHQQIIDEDESDT